MILRIGLFSSFSASSKLFPDLADRGFADQKHAVKVFKDVTGGSKDTN